MKKIITLLLTLTLLLSCVTLLPACGNLADSETDGSTESNVPETDNDETEGNVTLDTDLDIRVSVLNGTTGFGAAQLMDATKNGKAALKYDFKVETDASVINTGLINNEIDIAALPTNAASVLYNKTEGGVKVIALNTLGVLYVVENGNTVNSLADLAGKTVYCPAQNPEFIFRAVCQMGGVENVTVDTTYAQPAALMSAVAASEEGMIAVLPEPVLSVAMNKNANLRVALDLTDEWSQNKGSASLVQGCIVVRTAFLEEHPAEVAKFLEEYKASIEFLNSNVADAANMVVDLGIYAGAAAVAEKAIPKCNIVYMDGEEMQTALSAFLEVMYGVAPASVGGKLPEADFYYKK